MKTKLVPFDIERAKQGAKVVTRCGYPVRIGLYDIKGASFPISGAVTEEDNTEVVRSFTKEGRHYAVDVDSDYDLFIEEEEQEKTRREYSGTDSIFVPNDDEGIIEELIDAINGLWDNDALPMPLSMKRKDAWLAWLEKQGVEKPADNKPKFQKGDWVIDGLGIVHQIIRVVENLGSHTYGYGTDDGFYIHDSESGVRLWNINDAKDGDVLMKGEVIFIFNKMLGEWIYCHSSISYKDGSSINLNNCGLINNEVYPATKEQRDFLFQKLKEAGYKWDPVKKELKKIESEEKKELKKVKPKFQKGNWVIDKQGTVHQIANVIENVTNHTYGYDVVGGGYFNENVEGIRFWTIQDARNGTVLACDTCIVLFKEIDGLNIKCHCTYHFMDTPMFFVDTLQNKSVFYPATKEQYDLLFQKIKEEGYQWDSERKELKKIKYKDDMAEKEVKQKSSFNEFGFRRMTNQELSWWLRDHPEECREFKYEEGGDYVYSSYDYTINQANTQVWGKLIRRNGGEWQEPLVEI